MLSPMEAYLDIESTGLYAGYDEITVIGIYLTRGFENKFVQLVGKDITADSLKSILKGVSVLYTYNGSRFDLPFIRQRLDIDLTGLHTHCDLMFHCWRRNLYGGLKSVERQLGIERRLWGVDGYEAVRLWQRYVNNFDEDALQTLLAYNKEDVVNLKALKERLL